MGVHYLTLLYLYFLLVAVHFIQVHLPGGDRIDININEISSIRQPRDIDGYNAKDVNCVLIMTNGRQIGTTESCLEIIKQISSVEK